MLFHSVVCKANPVKYPRIFHHEGAVPSMHRMMVCFACITALLAPMKTIRQSGRVFPAHTGLLLVARNHDGVALAADGAQVNADGTISQAQKIFQVGKFGAVALAGSTSFQDPVSKPVRGQVDAAGLTAAWLNAHAQATVDTAERELTAVLARELNQFFSTRNPGASAGGYNLAVIFAGYADGKFFLKGTKFFLTATKAKPVRTEPISDGPAAGEVWAFGVVSVEKVLMAGNSAALTKFAAEPAVQKIRSGTQESAAITDYMQAFDTILQATESPEGKKIAGGKPAVAAPNKIASISMKDGFAWSQPHGSL
jgi:hypothetical protein